VRNPELNLQTYTYEQLSQNAHVALELFADPFIFCNCPRTWPFHEHQCTNIDSCSGRKGAFITEFQDRSADNEANRVALSLNQRNQNAK